MVNDGETGVVEVSEEEFNEIEKNILERRKKSLCELINEQQNEGDLYYELRRTVYWQDAQEYPIKHQTEISRDYKDKWIAYDHTGVIASHEDYKELIALLHPELSDEELGHMGITTEEEFKKYLEEEKKARRFAVFVDFVDYFTD